MSNSLDNLRVLLVGPIPPPNGGMAIQTRKLKQLLTGEGTTVELVAVNAPYSPAIVGKIPVVRAFFRLIPYIFRLYKQVADADVVHIMANSGWSWHLFTAPAIWVARLRNTPVTVNYRGGYAEDFFAKSWALVNFSLKRVQNVFVPSDYLQDVFAEYDVAAEIVPNILDKSVFYPEVETSELADIHAPVLLVTRNLEDIYDIPTAIRCLKRLVAHFPDARLLVAGSGPRLEQLKQLVTELDLQNNVEFLGRLDSDAIARLYRQADIMLNPSTVDNSPNSVIEALASGLPVVSTNVGGIPRLVTTEHDAILVSPGDDELMAQKVIELCEQPQKRALLITNGLQTVKKFHWENVSKKLLMVYTQAIGNKGAR